MRVRPVGCVPGLSVDQFGQFALEQVVVAEVELDHAAQNLDVGHPFETAEVGLGRPREPVSAERAPVSRDPAGH